VISPYAKHGFVDHQTLSFDAYVKFIEDDFLNSQRLNPSTDGRPDPRPDVRETASILGDLSADFNFTQTPRPPLVLAVHPSTTLTAIAPFGPIAPSATPGNGQALVQWKPPLSDGGAPISAYRVTPYLNGVAQQSQYFPSTPTAETITGLTNGSTYTFTVTAVNSQGYGFPSLATDPITVGTPGPPESPLASPANSAAHVSWAAPADNGTGGVSAYEVIPYRNGIAQQPQYFGPTPTAQTITGLTNADIYTFTITAWNSRGSGPPSDPTPPITVGAPTKPTAVAAAAGAARATVYWTAPSTNNGSPITAYTVTPYLGTAAQPPHTFTSTATAQTVTGLQSGKTYTFTVAATNANGTSPQSAPSNTVTPT
jgi:titin